jgi:hypothetical protein
LAAELLEVDRSRGNRRDEAIALKALSTAAFARGDVESGSRLAHDAASLAERGGSRWFCGVTLVQTAEHLIAANEPERARRDFLDGLEDLLSVRDRVNLPISLAAGAAIAAGLEAAEVAGTLWGAVEAVELREPRPTTRENMREYEPYLERVRGADFERARDRGHALSLEEAVDYALSNLD